MKGKTIIMFIIFLFLSIILIFEIRGFYFLNYHSNFFKNECFKISINSNFQVVKKEHKKKYLFGIKDEMESYDYFKGRKKIANVKIVKRELENQDFLIFYRIKRFEKDLNKKIKIGIDFSNIPMIKDLNSFVKEKEYSNTVGMDKTTLPNLYIEFPFKKGSLLVSKLYRSNLLQKKYQSGSISNIRHLVKEEVFQVQDNYLSLSLNLENDYLEGWLLYSPLNLFNSTNDLEEYLEFMHQNLSVSPWLTFNGQYTKIPYSIDPYTTEGYARNPGTNQGKLEFYKYKETGKNIYYDLTWNKIIDLYKMPRHEKGVWFTEYTSTYISKPYKIYAPFIDTRHNENISQFLEMVSFYYNMDDLKNDSLLYPDYIINEVTNKNILFLKKDKYLIPDYFKEKGTEISHASLNHQLGTANLLLESYKRTKNIKYYKIGMEIVEGIKSLGNDWIKEDGDLWYRINPDLSFQGTDYKTLTLNDLLTIQETLEDIGNNRIIIFDKYIESKYKYLNSIDYKIDKDIMEKLKKQGFIN